MLSGRVKYFDACRGFGFIVPDSGGDDVFVHHTLARGNLPPGAAVRYEAEYQDGRGERAVALELAERPAIEGDTPATVKWFDRSKGYGFALTADGHDVFLAAETLLMSGVAALRTGQPVRVALERLNGRLRASVVEVV